jgi:hypothetical protein
MLRGSGRDKFKLPDAQGHSVDVSVTHKPDDLRFCSCPRFNISVEFLRGGEICRDQPFVRNLSQNSDDGQLGTSELARAFSPFCPERPISQLSRAAKKDLSSRPSDERGGVVNPTVAAPTLEPLRNRGPHALFLNFAASSEPFVAFPAL